MTVLLNNPQSLDGQTFRLSWSSDLEDPVFHIYQDGLLIDITEATTYDFSIVVGETLVVEILDTDDAPAQAFPGRVLLGWYPVSGAASYRVDEYVGGSWVERATINDSSRGFYTYRSRFLEDSVLHQFRIVPIGINEGDPEELSIFLARHPDPPAQNFSYTSGEVTINA